MQVGCVLSVHEGRDDNLRGVPEKGAELLHTLLTTCIGGKKWWYRGVVWVRVGRVCCPGGGKW